MALGSMDPLLVTNLRFDTKRACVIQSFAIARQEKSSLALRMTSQKVEINARQRAGNYVPTHRREKGRADSLFSSESSRHVLGGNSNDCKLALSKTTIKKKNQDGFIFPVRAQAEIERADEQMEFGRGGEAAENGRKWRREEQDSKKAKALGESAIYPIMRVFRNDLCSLEVTGDAKASHVIEAMGADGGFTAAEELSKGRSLMTVETIIPGRAEAHITVSTKLLAPTQLVKNRAKNVSAQKGAPRKPSLSSGNALATAFQSVVMQHLLSFDIHVHSPGQVREMANLANEKEDAVVASLESRDSTVLEGLAEAICAYSLENIKDDFYKNVYGKKSEHKKIFPWGDPEWIWALNKAIGIRPLSEIEIWEHAKRILDGPPLSVQRTRTYQNWWPPPSLDLLQSNILPKEGLNSWSIEFLPIHKIRIDTSKVNAAARGWQTTDSKEVFELRLTHAQLVDLADALDVYYEDAYTTPSKTLHSRTQLTVSQLSRSKVTKALWTATLSCIAGGVLLVACLVVARLKPSSSVGLQLNTFSTSSSRSASSFTNKWCRVQTDHQPVIPKNADISAEEMEALCLLVVNRVKDAFNLPGQVESCPERGAWIGPDLTLWGRKQSSVDSSVDSLSGDDLVEQQHGDTVNRPSSEQDFDSENVTETSAGEPLLLFQVVLSRDGKVLGFQPGNQPAIPHWLEYPFAQELHRDHHLGPGVIEHGLKYAELSEDAVAIELLCKTAMNSPSVSARPLKL